MKFYVKVIKKSQNKNKSKNLHNNRANINIKELGYREKLFLKRTDNNFSVGNKFSENKF